MLWYVTMALANWCSWRPTALTHTHSAAACPVLRPVVWIVVFLQSVVGTPLFMAPEMWEGGVPYTSSADIWSLGCLIYELSALRPPFSASK
jgi:serine/threonine protein kinase